MGYVICVVLFTIFSQQNLSGRLLIAVIDEQKSNLNSEFKLKSITINHQIFFMKVLWKYYEHDTYFQFNLLLILSQW